MDGEVAAAVQILVLDHVGLSCYVGVECEFGVEEDLEVVNDVGLGEDDEGYQALDEVGDDDLLADF